MNELHQVPYFEGLLVDRQMNIYVDKDPEPIKIPYHDMRFYYYGQMLYTHELANMAYYGVTNPMLYTRHVELSDGSIMVHDRVFRKMNISISGYFISDSGIIYSSHRCRLRKQEIDKDGYHRISFPYSNMTHMAIHRLVYESWVDKIPEGYVIDHQDTKKWHNHYRNLQAMTAADNSRKATIDGAYAKTIQWTPEIVENVCQMMIADKTIKDIASVFGITPNDKKMYKNFRNQLYTIRRGNSSWKDISSKYDFSKYDGNIRPDSKYTDSEILKMRQMYANGDSIEEIANVFGEFPTGYFRRLVKGEKRKIIKIAV